MTTDTAKVKDFLSSEGFFSLLFQHHDGNVSYLPRGQSDPQTARLSESPPGAAAWVNTDIDGQRWGVATEIAKGSTPHPLPSLRLTNEHDEFDYAVWLIATPATDQLNPFLASVSAVPDASITGACPVPGVDGWQCEVVEETTRLYGVADLIIAPRINEVVRHGEVDPDLLAREIELAFSPNGSQTQPGRWRNTKLTVGKLVDGLSKHMAGEKDGNAFVGGVCIDGKRLANAVRHLDILTIDLDTGQSIDRMRATLQGMGLFAVIYTTHSHGADVTAIKKDELVKMYGEDAPLDVDQVCSYLLQKKRYPPEVLQDAELLQTTHTSEGIKVRVKHQPMSKFRVVLLLKDRFTIAERASTQREAIREWKERYIGASQMLGAYYDRSCTDPSRLFFLPRHPKDATEWRVEIIAGRPLDIEECPRVTAEEERLAGLTPIERVAETMNGGANREYKTDGLRWFFGKHGGTFDIDNFFLANDPDGDRGLRQSGLGRVHRCPNDDAHSDAGNENDKGFFCVNAGDSETGHAVAHCSHNSCAHLDRIDFVDMICERVGITGAEGLMKWVPETIEDDAHPGGEPADSPKPKRKKRRTQCNDDDEAAFEETLQAFHGRWHFVGEGATGRYVGGETRNGDLEFRQEGALIRLYEDQSIIRVNPLTGVSKRVNPVREWLSRPEFADHRHTGLCFLPGQSQETSEPYFNEWRGFAVEPKQGRWDRLREHIFEVLCSGSDRDYQWIMAWMGHVLQNVGNIRKKLTVSPVIRGIEGAGKSVVFDNLRAILGKRHGISLSRAEQAIGKFNAPLALALLTQLEEAFFAGDPRINGPLKDLLTGKDMMLERKGIDPVQVANYSHFVIISNSERPVPIDGFSRRYYPIECSDKKANQEAWFEPIFAEMDTPDGLAAMAWDLLHWQPPGGDWKLLRRFPQTEAGNRMIAAGLSCCERFILTFAWRGGCGHGVGSAELPDRAGDEATIKTADLARHFAEWADDEEKNPRLRDRIKTDAKTVGETLRQMLPSLAKPGDTSIRGRVFPHKTRVLEMLRMHRSGGYRAFLDSLDEDGE